MADFPARTGLRIRSLSGVHPEVRRACLEFAKWLRHSMEFPIRVIVYLKKDYRIRTRARQQVTASFFAPYDKNDEPYIRVATGDYEESLIEVGKDNALAGYLHSIAHELVHYQQWLADAPFSERQAVSRAKKVVWLYAQTREHP
ncbi:hypothetical protein OMP38_32755 [Cohnella ginsengisoli]|uniref:Uncharacterized protein n=1 Tax=Cohnella ginsengisoli TaxID=425004 RepID=A0A9X4KMW5_9BACL|nr:hypothetical protein [Cohnella ginsengisoli]MDG0795068.1 hypothetical protein [Cohnella ginsengisoli]